MRTQDTGEGIGVIQFTMAMLAVYVAVFAAAATGANIAVLYGFNWRIASGETWRLLTTTLVHGSIFHFLFNIIMFFRLSQAIERWQGPWIASAFYIFVAAGSAAPQAMFSASGAPAVGASGAIYGLFGFLWVCRRRYDIAAETVTPGLIQTMLAWFLICFVITFFGGNIANIAHAFGLLFGWLIGQIVVASRHARWALILGTAALWTGLVVMTYGPVWNKVMGPSATHGYRWNNLPQSNWGEIEEAYGRNNPVIPGTE